MRLSARARESAFLSRVVKDDWPDWLERTRSSGCEFPCVSKDEKNVSEIGREREGERERDGKGGSE